VLCAFRYSRAKINYTSIAQACQIELLYSQGPLELKRAPSGSLKAVC